MNFKEITFRQSSPKHWQEIFFGDIEVGTIVNYQDTIILKIHKKFLNEKDYKDFFCDLNLKDSFKTEEAAKNKAKELLQNYMLNFLND